MNVKLLLLGIILILVALLLGNMDLRDFFDSS